MKKAYHSLKNKHRNNRDSWFSENSQLTSLRIHRALSWLKSAEESTSLDMSFISLWISFNSLYGEETDFSSYSTPQRIAFKHFFHHIIFLDNENKISSQIWADYSNLFRFLINNKFMFSPFWSYQQGKISERQWKEQFETSIAMSKKALGKQDCVTFLEMLFERLYVLRNQIIHGGSSFESSINREQLKLGFNVLSTMVPIMINILIDNHDIDWGKPCYPPITDEI